MKSKKIRWGILACGRIANKFCSDLALVENTAIEAVASRHLPKAQEFAKAHGAAKAYGSYEELAHDPDVQIVYIASPHNFHFEHTMLCLNHGKSVLCEKPIAVNHQQASVMYDLAKKNGLFLMEAMWTKFLPHYRSVKMWISQDAIGDIKAIEADFGFKAKVDLSGRLFNPKLAGGSLLDIGIYPIMCILDILGPTPSMEVDMNMSEQGVDLEAVINFDYDKHTATAWSTIKENTPTICNIIGSEGQIFIQGRFHENSTALLFDINGRLAQWSRSTEGFGYYYMIKHVNQAIIDERSESDIHSSHDSLQLIKCLDQIRDKNGFKYPFES